MYLKTNKQKAKALFDQICNWKKQNQPWFEFSGTPSAFADRDTHIQPISLFLFTKTNFYPEKLSTECFPSRKQSEVGL